MWIEARLADLDTRLTGPIEPLHDRPWSSVLRMPTDRGLLFFKPISSSSSQTFFSTGMLLKAT